MIKGRRRSNRRVHRTKGFPSCLPSQADLEAVYLGKLTPSSAGVVYDEIGSNDAQLVNSYAMQGDGIVYAHAGTEAIHNGTELNLEFTFMMTGVSKSLGAKRGASDEYEFYTRVYTDKFQLGLSDDGTSFTAIDFPIANLNDGEMHNVKISYSAGNLIFNLDGVEQTTTTAVTSIYSGAGVLSLLSSFLYIIWEGYVAYAKFGNAEFNLCNGGLIEDLPNTGTAGGDATLYNATYPTLWGLQDVFHYNFLNGFDLYENGTAGEEIRVPIGHAFTQTGYTFTATYQAGTWHNGAETEINLPDTLTAVISGDVPDPLSSAEIEQNYNGADIAFSNTEEGKKRKIAMYSSARTASEVTKINKCIG